MPLVGVQLTTEGPVYTPEEALAAARKGDLGEFTYELVAAMLDTQLGAEHEHHREERLSTTALTSKCFRSTYLERTEDFVELLPRMWASFRGTMFHGRLEQYEGPNSVAEVRYHAELPELGTFSGSPDLVDIERGLLYDYKFCKEVPRFDRVWPDHIEQLNINRWLVDHAHTAEYKGTEHDLTDVAVRKQFVPADWQGLICVYMDDRGPKPLTAFESIDVPKVGGVGTKKQRVPAIWSDEVATEFILTRYAERRAHFDNKEIPPIPVGYENQGHPLCGYCAVRDRCVELDRNGC